MVLVHYAATLNFRSTENYLIKRYMYVMIHHLTVFTYMVNVINVVQSVKFHVSAMLTLFLLENIKE
jgi:hypothetical protein